MKTRNLILSVLLLTTSFAGFGQIKVQNLMTEDRIDPVGLDMARPRFSWQMISDQRNVMQTAYELRVSTSIPGLSKERETVWQSKKSDLRFLGICDL